MRVLSSHQLQKTQGLLSRCCQFSIRVLVVLLTATLLNFALPEPAQAATLNWRDPTVTWTSGIASGASQIFPNTGTVGNSGVRVRMTLTDPNGITVDLADFPPNTGLNGGATPESTLLVLIDSAVLGESIELQFDYLDPAGNPVPVENARFVITDIDSAVGAGGTGGVWQDEIIAGGTVTPTILEWPTAATTDPRFDGLVGGGGIFPFITGTYTVQTPITGDTATAIRLEDANNATPNGSVLVAYGGTIQRATFTYRSGAGADPDPGQQGIGFYNVFFDPVAIGTSKQVTNAVDNGNGTYTITYQVIVENMGGVELRNVQLAEDLSTTFTAPTTFNVTDVRLIATTRAGTPAPNINPGFTGTGANTNLLDGVGTLLPRELDLNNNQTAAGGTVTVQFDVLVTPNGNFGLFENQVQASGTSPNNQTVTDDSVDGADPDPDGDGSAIESSPTPVTLVPNIPLIGVSKGLVSVSLEPTGAFLADTARATYNIVVRNLGGEDLNDVQLTENLTTTFGAASNFDVSALTGPTGAGTVARNPAFDGDTDQNLLAAGGTLAVGAEATFQLVVDINTASGTLPAQPFENQVEARGVGATSGGITTDLSNDAGSVPAGTDPIDPNGNLNPNEPGENTSTPLTFSLTPDVRLVKRITGVTRGGVPVAIAGINGFNDQPGDANDNQLQQLSNSSLPLGVFNIAGGTLQTGDVLEYTIYLWNNGLNQADDVQICDEIQPPSQLDNASLSFAPASAFPTLAAFGGAGPLSAANAGDPLPAFCPSAPGNFPTGGGVLLDPGGGFDLPSRQVAAIRFEVNIP